MNKKLQDLAWSLLPKEFKEEVKKEYKKGYVCETLAMLITLFGHHNLTSDAEGEEMLTVPRSQIQKLYSSTKKVNDPSSKDYINGILNTLDTLFGSKCLPDDTMDGTKEPKPAEPKLDRGQKCKIIGGKGTKELIGQIGTLTSFVPEENAWAVKLSDMSFIYLTESDLEPYTEPEKESRNLSQETANCDKHFDRIVKDGFSKERRLNIAAMAMQGLLNATSVERFTLRISPEAIAEAAFEYADALINMNKKGGLQ